jgi:hypothetical protein
LFVGEKQLFVGVVFTRFEYFGFDFNVGDWNVSLGYPSWFFIAPEMIPMYIAYTLTLGFISFYFLKKIGLALLSEDMLWYCWLVYLMAPWLLTFTVFIYALFVFLVIKIVISRIIINLRLISKMECYID